MTHRQRGNGVSVTTGLVAFVALTTGLLAAVLVLSEIVRKGAVYRKAAKDRLI